MATELLSVAKTIVCFLFPKAREIVSQSLPEHNKFWRNFKYQLLPDYRKVSVQLSSTCKAKLKAALFQYQQVVTKVTSFEFEAFDEWQLKTLLAEGRERLKSQTMLLHSTGNEAVTAFFDIHNLSDDERLTAMALAFSCQLLLHVDDLKSLQEHYSYLLDNLFRDVNLQGHIKGYTDEMERKSAGKLGNIKILNSYSKTTVINLQKLLDCVYAVVKQIGWNQNPEIALQLMNDITMPTSLKEKRHSFITMHSVSMFKLPIQNGLPFGTSIFFEGKITRALMDPERFVIVFQVDDENIAFCYDVRLKSLLVNENLPKISLNITKPSLVPMPTIFINSCYRGKWGNPDTVINNFQANVPFHIDIEVTSHGLMISHNKGSPYRFLYREDLTPEKIREIVIRGHVEITSFSYTGEGSQSQPMVTDTTPTTPTSPTTPTRSYGWIPGLGPTIEEISVPEPAGPIIGWNL